MPVELVHVFAADGLKLDGALHRPATSPTLGLDALLILHGTGSNFYGSRFLNYIAQRANQWGAAALVANTRGHDQIATALVQREDGSTAGRTIGAAYEKVDDCRLDVAAWLKLLGERGYRRLGILGHSLGAVKSVYAAAHDPLPNVVALVAVSPPRLSHSHFTASAKAPIFSEDLARAERYVAEGRPETLLDVRFPIPYVITAAGFIDKYGPDERYNLLKFVDRVSVPTLYTFGSIEVQQAIAFQGFPEALEEKKAAAASKGTANLSTVVIGRGDHHYTGVQDDLLNAIERWLRKLPRDGK